MSGIAYILLKKGYKVQGSDLQENAYIKRLVPLEVKIHLPHKGDNVADAKTVVYSSAVSSDNAELVIAKQKGLAIFSRGQMLAHLMENSTGIAVCGTHGKTTTSSFISFLLLRAGLEPTFIVGGDVVGEKVARAIDLALKKRNPLVIVSSTGGARMMEAAYSLMQMAKTSAKLAQLSDARIPYISVLTDPTTGGVTASYAMLGDVHLAEPGALIGFAGPRVIKQTIGRDLPKGFQRTEFLQEKGFVDVIVHRKDMKETITKILRLLLD